MRLDALERLAQNLKRGSGVIIHAPKVTTQQRAHSDRLLAALQSRPPAANRLDDSGAGKLPFVWGRSGFTADEIAGDRWVML